MSVGFTNAAAIVHELIEARDEKRLLRLQRQVAAYKLLIIDELGFVPLSQTVRRAAVRGVLAKYERRLHDRHQQSAVRRMDLRVRFSNA